MTKVQTRKSIKRPISSFKQLNILKKDQNMFSTLQFKDLPNEIIFHVFSYLKIVELLKCGQVSKRFRAISIDVWPKKINLCHSKVPVKFLQKLLERECKYLSLSESILDGTLNLPKASKLDSGGKYLSFSARNLPKASKLKYLNLSGVGLKCNQFKNLEKLLESCYSLQKLSLRKCHVSYDLINSICYQNGKSLQVLDLSRCTICPNERLDSHLGLDCMNCKYAIPIWEIVEYCTELKELSLHKTNLTKKSISVLVSGLTSKIEKLDLNDMLYLKDEHVKTLVTRCNKIIELNVGGTTSMTKQSLKFIIENLKLSLVKLTFKFTIDRFDLSDLFQLKTMTKLKLLYYDNKEAQKIIDQIRVKKIMPNLRINSGSGTTRIAGPCQSEYNYHNSAEKDEQGLWEINAEREELFTRN